MFGPLKPTLTRDAAPKSVPVIDNVSIFLRFVRDTALANSGFARISAGVGTECGFMLIPCRPNLSPPFLKCEKRAGEST
jgi:hypothetical protein